MERQAALTACFNNAACRWLQTTPAERWDTPWAALDFCTVLRGILQLPADAVVGPWAPLLGDLHPNNPRPAGSRPVLSCGAIYRGLHQNPISVIEAAPEDYPSHHVVVRLPLGAFIVCASGAMPLGLRRILDTLFPPPDRFVQTNLWCTVSPAPPV